MPIDPKRVQAVFMAALEHQEPGSRAELLERECSGDEQLRRRVEALLRANDEPASYLEKPAVAPSLPTEAYPGITERPGTMIGPYKLMEKIGEGGFGLVFVAEQTEPVKRKVALKVIKPGMDSKQVIARFEAERQALAMMDHPNIARVLDAGTTDTGRPYFVMELVRGIPITDYCDQNHLTPDERLELFVSVCHAIQHAHQKGIIHRDIKPSNVLVTSHDGKPVAKVIDFGVAKAIHQHLTERTIYTNFAQMIGTPLYMSPEQAEMSGLDIDTRSDIYSLGVLLYELLTGSTPLERKRLAQAAYDEIRRVIREEEPPRPSDRLSTSETLPSVAANRKTEPARLSRMLKGELDWIVMKALEKDRTRRYETANGFARDIQLYLNDEVVEARPVSTGYRLRKLVSRNKGRVLAAALVFLALVVGVAVSTWQAVRATRAEQFALQARQSEVERAEGERIAKLDAQVNEKLAGERLVQVEAEKKKAEAEKQIAQAVKDFLQNKLLAQADTTAQANALLKAGGLASEAKMNPTIRELLDRAAKELAPDMIELNFPMQPLVQAEILQTIGDTYRGIGESHHAIDFLKRSEVLRQHHLGHEHPDTISSMISLATAYQVASKPDLALPLFEETLKIRIANLGREHPLTLDSMNNLALAYQAVGKMTLALQLLEDALRHYKAKLGLDHQYTLRCMNNLALAYQAAGNLDLALPLFEGTLKRMIATLSTEHPDTVVCMGTLAGAYQAAGKHALALPLSERTLTLMKAKFGPEHYRTLSSMICLTLVYDELKQFDKSELLYRELLRLNKQKSGNQSLAYAMTLRPLSRSLLHQKKWTDAESLLRNCLAIREKMLSDAWTIFDTKSLLGEALLGQKKYAEAEPLLLAGYEGMKTREKTIPPQGATRIPEALDRLIQLYTETNKPEEVKKWQAEKLKISKTPEKK